MGEVRVLGEHTFPDRFRVRTVMALDGQDAMFVAAVGAQLGGLDTGRPAVWRWLALERLRPPFERQLADIRNDAGQDFRRECFRRLVATWGIPWAEVSLETILWQRRKVDRAPRWLLDMLFERADFTVDRLDRLRRLVGLDEDVTEMQSALSAVRAYEERAFERPVRVRG